MKPANSIDLTKALAFRAIVIRSDPIRDLALLRVDALPKDIPPLTLGNMNSLQVGQDVHAIGHPRGEVWSYTTGTISQIRPQYEWTSPENTTHRATVIQTQTALNPGNSGGPLLDDAGLLVGVNAFKFSGDEALNYAVSVGDLKDFLRDTQRGAPQPTPISQNTLRKEQYGEYVVGVYIRAKAPPPDLWLVYESGGGSPSYGLQGRRDYKTLDTVIKLRGEPARILAYYYDTDCDGGLDLRGTSSGKDGDSIDQYAAVDPPKRMADWAARFISELRTSIPYSEVSVCR